MEMEMCTEEDIIVARTQSQSSHSRRESRVSKDVTVIEPAQTKRDLFEEDQDNDIREREADKKGLNKSKDSHKSENDDSDDDVVFVEKDFSKSSNGGKVSMGNIRKVDSSEKDAADVRMTRAGDVGEKEEYPTNVVNTSKPQDTRRCVVSENASYEGSDERVVEFSRDNKKENSHKDSKMNTDDDGQDEDDDGVNIYEDMPQDLDLFQNEEEL